MVPFHEPCTYNIGGLWRVAATLVRLAFDPEMKMHKKAQALKTLQQLYGNKALLGARSKPEAVALEQDLYGKVLKTLDSLQTPIHAMFVSNLFRLLHTIMQADRRSEGPPSLAWVEVQGCVERFRQRISKTVLKSIRKDYNVFNEGLRSLHNKNKPEKQRGEKRGAAQVNTDGEQQENLMKKSKKEKRNSLTDNTSPEGEGKVGKTVKKKKKNKGTPDPDNQSEKEDTTGPAKTMIDGDDITIIDLAPERQEKKMKKKKKNKLIKRKLDQEEEKRTAQGDQEQNASLVSDSPLTPEAKKKMKKRKSRKMQANGTM
ncbi:hypothetical protein GWK47_025418 [Chionoecetes opilio]|uniref:Uncharacterized protein n=1 Tax=Chionoecetes opilio TaxID=41210 RepID=A0A8J8WNL8_CHIOP|nr:hypothetical protein GWK47_025418 [Chionoecetes opilio]